MIAQLTGKITQKGDGHLVISVAGVGFKVSVTAESLNSAKAGSEKSLFTFLAVREDSLELYGFDDEMSRNFFELLMTVSGIGPKSALSILNVASVKALQSAIATGDASHLTKTTGIGSKKAERIIMELKDKLIVGEGEIEAHRDNSDVIEALKALGYSQKEARDAVQKISKENISAEEKIKQALKLLGR